MRPFHLPDKSGVANLCPERGVGLLLRRRCDNGLPRHGNVNTLCCNKRYVSPGPSKERRHDITLAGGGRDFDNLTLERVVDRFKYG